MTARFLADLPLFRGLDASAHERLAGLAEERVIPRNQPVFEHGEAPDAFYVLRKGAIALFRDEVGKPVQLLARLGAGDWFGEMGLIEDLPRSATARATEDSRLLRFPRQSLLRFLEGHPQLSVRLEFAAARRHHENASAALHLGSSKEVRMRIDRRALLEVDGEEPVSVQVENLSLGGVSLSRVPGEWKVGTSHRIALIHGDRRLEATARIRWTSRGQAGLGFVGHGPDHELEVLRLIRCLLRSDAF